jgi:hypothetical protein
MQLQRDNHENYAISVVHLMIRAVVTDTDTDTDADANATTDGSSSSRRTGAFEYSGFSHFVPFDMRGKKILRRVQSSARMSRLLPLDCFAFASPGEARAMALATKNSDSGARSWPPLQIAGDGTASTSDVQTFKLSLTFSV